MKINTKIRYGLRMLTMLADMKTVVNTAELGKKMLVSPKYLRKLAGPLERYGLIKSVQGIYGGYTLNKKPEEIKISSLFEAFKENVNMTGCKANTNCPLSTDCLTRPLWDHLDKVIQDEFYRISLHDILERKFTPR